MNNYWFIHKYKQVLMRPIFLCCLLLCNTTILAQLPVCDFIYLLKGNRGIYNFDPSLPVSAANPVKNTISTPRSYGALAVLPVLGSAGPALTFYSIDSMRYYTHYDPATTKWVSSPHRASSVNIAGGGGYLFAFDAISGNVYRYDGKAPDVLIAHVADWSSNNGPYDMVADCAGNWYIFKTAGTEGFLRKYDASGKLLHDWVLNNPDDLALSDGTGGFAMIGNTLYANSSNIDPPHLVLYSIGADTVTAFREIVDSDNIFSLSASFFSNTLDMGSCPASVLTVPAVSIAASDTVLCAGAGPVTFTAAPNAGGDAPVYTWRLNGVVLSGSGPVYTYTPANGDRISCMMTSNAPCASPLTANSDTVEITILDLPPAPVVANNGPLCAGDKVVLSVTAVPGTTYSWTGPAGFTASGPDLSFTAMPSSAGVYTVTGTKGKCISPESNTTLVIHPLPLTQHFEDQSLCEGRDLLLAATEEPNTDYLWYRSAGGFSSSGPRLVLEDIVMNQTGRYLFRARNTFGCEQNDSVLLTVYPETLLTLSGDTAICKGDFATLSVTTNVRSLQWIPAVIDAPSGNVRVNPDATTTYTVIAKADNSFCADDTASVTVSVSPLPQVQGFDTVVLYNTRLEFLPVYSTGLVKWQWSPGDQLSCTDCPNPVLSFMSPSRYEIQVTDQTGCTASAVVTVELLCDASAIRLPNAFTPNGDGRNEIFYVRGQGFTVTSFRIYNRYGQEVFTKANFEPNDRQYGWDGSVNGQPVSEASAYVYIVDGICKANGMPLSAKGTVFMVR